ncbi:hypothetical protein A143_09670 [Vibrio splendidus ZS-139]|nr:hypothetical protein A143_09670 [Vibrio splendidus ZS-139]
MLNTIKKKLSGSEFYRNVFLLARGTTIAQALPILISPILTRIYGPEDFGILAIYVALMSILGVISTGRYELSIMLPKSNAEAIQLVWLTILTSFIISILILILIILGFEDLSQHVNFPEEYQYLIYFIPLSVFILGICQSITTLLNRNKKYKEMSLTKVISNSSSGFTQISGSGLNGGLLIGYISGQISGLLYLLFVFKKVCYSDLDLKSNKLRPNLRTMSKLAYKYRVFPQVNAISSLLNTSSVQLVPLLLTAFFSSVTTGFYSLSQRILQMPMSLLGSSIALVYFQKANELSSNKEKLKALTLSINKKLLVIGIIPISLTLLLGDYLFELVFGEEWKVAGEYAQYLAPWIYLVFVSSPLSHLLTVLGKQKELLIFNTFLFFTRIGWLLFAYYLVLEPGTAIFVHANIGTVAWLAFVYYVMNLANVNLKEVTKQLLPFFIIVIVCSISGNYI